ncbi:helix-turn-helix domain-containing protein [Paenibacillus sp. FSL H3-0286]|uniref:helix-turn-helix domain-containing protein n=1 Tax=Paenibacillus sp. FSL H3-0286 TaxID=2921427 RepID=UPI0032463C50
MDIFSRRLKWARENRGFSQKELAEYIGMSPQGFGKIENGLREPNLENLSKLPYILNESTDFLLGVTEIDSASKQMIKEFKDTLKIINLSKHELEKFRSEKSKISEDVYKDILQRQIDSEEELLKYFLNIHDGLRNDLIDQLKKVPGNEMIAEDIIDDITLEQRLEFNLRLSRR